jgi:hypothetical protein
MRSWKMRDSAFTCASTFGHSSNAIISELSTRR